MLQGGQDVLHDGPRVAPGGIVLVRDPVKRDAQAALPPSSCARRPKPIPRIIVLRLFAGRRNPYVSRRQIRGSVAGGNNLRPRGLQLVLCLAIAGAFVIPGGGGGRPG